jgi:hypothetical protein
MRRILVAAVLVWAAGAGFVLGQQPSGTTAGQSPAVTESTGPVITEYTPDGAAPGDGIVSGSACGPQGCGASCDGCGHTDCGWVSGEYLLWYYHHAPLPPLVTTGPASSAGVLGSSGTTVLFGGDEEKNEPSSGARITLGYWLDDCKTSSVELSGFFLGWRAEGFSESPNTNTVLARPFFDVLTGTQSAFPVAHPDVSVGDVLASNRTILYGAEANYLSCLCRNKAEPLNLCGCCLCCYQVDWLCGFRYLNFQETLDVVQDSIFDAKTGLYPAAFAAFKPLAGDTVLIADSFATRNQFYGPQTGLDAVVYQGDWAFELRGKIAVGASDEVANAIGETNISGPVVAAPLRAGGLLVSPGSIGRSRRVQLAAVPETTFNIAYHPNDHVALYVGYNMLYWTSVARSGNQVNQNVTTTQLPVFGAVGAPATTPTAVTSTDMWVQGLTVGVEFTW